MRRRFCAAACGGRRLPATFSKRLFPSLHTRRAVQRLTLCPMIIFEQRFEFRIAELIKHTPAQMQVNILHTEVKCAKCSDYERVKCRLLAGSTMRNESQTHKKRIFIYLIIKHRIC